MINVTIGGETIAVKPLTFAVLQAAWPFITALSGQQDRFARSTAHLGIVAAAVLTDVLPPEAEMVAAEQVFQWIRMKKRVATFPELVALDASIVEILHEAGFTPPEDQQPGESQATSLSMAISSPSSSASSPEVLREETLPASGGP